MHPNHQHPKLKVSPHKYNKYIEVKNSGYTFHVNMHSFQANFDCNLYKILKPHVYPKQHPYFKILYPSQETAVHLH